MSKVRLSSALLTCAVPRSGSMAGLDGRPCALRHSQGCLERVHHDVDIVVPELDAGAASVRARRTLPI